MKEPGKAFIINISSIYGIIGTAILVPVSDESSFVHGAEIVVDGGYTTN
jgi:hypothetical protein